MRVLFLGFLMWLSLGCEQAEVRTMDPVVTENSPSEISGVDTRVALYGDLHVHSKLSFDAWIFGTRATPDDAYNFAKGAELIHPAGIPMQLRRPLDFLSVTDHGTYLGMFEQMNNPSGSV